MWASKLANHAKRVFVTLGKERPCAGSYLDDRTAACAINPSRYVKLSKKRDLLMPFLRINEAASRLSVVLASASSRIRVELHRARQKSVSHGNVHLLRIVLHLVGICVLIRSVSLGNSAPSGWRVSGEGERACRPAGTSECRSEFDSGAATSISCRGRWLVTEPTHWLIGKAL